MNKNKKIILKQPLDIESRVVRKKLVSLEEKGCFETAVKRN